MFYRSGWLRCVGFNSCAGVSCGFEFMFLGSELVKGYCVFGNCKWIMFIWCIGFSFERLRCVSVSGYYYYILYSSFPSLLYYTLIYFLSYLSSSFIPPSSFPFCSSSSIPIYSSSVLPIILSQYSFYTCRCLLLDTYIIFRI